MRVLQSSGAFQGCLARRHPLCCLCLALELGYTLQLYHAAPHPMSLKCDLNTDRAPAVPHDRDSKTCRWPDGTLTVRPWLPANGSRARAMPSAPPLMVTVVSRLKLTIPCTSRHLSSRRISKCSACADGRCGGPNQNSLHPRNKVSDVQPQQSRTSATV